ncbi:hypothetical protein PFISCL1PPCAC_1452, partial [Pristionchus fissidentatus]
HSRVPVEVDVSDGARTLDVARVLVNSGLAPSTERLEVVEVGLKYVVGPPEGILADSVPVNSHNRLPVVVVRVDSDRNSESIAFSDHVEDELSVGGLVGGPVVDLNVEPEHAELGTAVLEGVHRCLHLGLGGSARGRMAGEEISVDIGQSLSPGVLDVLNAGLVNVSIALSNSSNVEMISGVLEASERRGRDRLNGVDTERRSGERDAEGEENEEKA